MDVAKGGLFLKSSLSLSCFRKKLKEDAPGPQAPNV